MYKVSVVVPTFSPGPYLYEGLDCLLKQTLEKAFFEVIIVLNGPREPYFTEIKEYIDKNKSLHVNLIHIEKLGVSWARNKGIEIAKGEQIAFIDDDDLVSTDYLEALLEIGGPDTVAISNLRTFEKNVLQTKTDYISNNFIKNKDKKRHSLFQLRGCMSSVCAKLIPRRVIGNSRFNTNFKIGEDSIFIAEISNGIKSICLSPEETLYYRRIREGSATRKTIDLGQEYRNTIKSLIVYIKIYLKAPGSYSFLFFLSRALAIFKTLVERFGHWFRQKTRSRT